MIAEDFLKGREVSYHVATDGESVLPFALSQDHKPIGDNDQGDNTGGMGAYSPVPFITLGIERKILERIIHPTIRAMAKEGRLYKGELYAGLMIDKNDDPHVLEFNCRFGDPETQPLLMRMRTDIVPILLACCNGELAGHKINWTKRPAVCVVMAAHGYPGSPQKFDKIDGLYIDWIKDTKVFQAGTALFGDQLVTAGGRVLGVTALGHRFSSAIKKAYAMVNAITWPGVYYRTDIGKKALEYIMAKKRKSN